MRTKNRRFGGLLYCVLFLAVHITPALAQRAYNETFETYTDRAIRPPWATEGAVRNGETIGIDIGRGQAYHGKNNAFIRMPTGWNALTRPFEVYTNAKYVVSANIRTSANVDTVYMGLRGANERILGEVKLGPSKQYQKFTVEVNTGTSKQARFYIGFWGKGTDGWIQVDDVSVTTNTAFF
jgi:hypothetical protein